MMAGFQRQDGHQMDNHLRQTAICLPGMNRESLLSCLERGSMEGGLIEPRTLIACEGQPKTLSTPYIGMTKEGWRDIQKVHDLDVLVSMCL